MKPYPTTLLTAWPTDRGSADRPAHALFPRWQEGAGTSLTWLRDAVRSVQSQEDAEFDRLYRCGHVLCGMATLMQVPKAQHVLAILDFALDLGRDLQTFQSHSLTYVVDLLITTTQAVLADFAQGPCPRDLTDVIDECRTYLATPLAATEKKPDPPASVSDPVPTPPPPVPTPEVRSPSEGTETPEELQIPPEKGGLTSAFCEESRESLARVGHRLVELEEASEPLPVVNDLFRAVHTVKGGARLLKIGKMEALSHEMESLLDRVRNGTLPVDARLIDVLLAGKKVLEELVDEVASGGPLSTRISACLAEIHNLATGREPTTREPAKVPDVPPAPVPPAPPVAQVSPRTDSIRVPTEKLDDVLNTASEVFISRIRLSGDVGAIHSAIRHFKLALDRMDDLGWESVLGRMAEANRELVSDLRTLTARGRPSVEALNALVSRFHQELAVDVRDRGLSTSEELMLNLLSLDELRKRLQKNVEHLERLSTRLQTGAMGFRMVPIAHLFDRFPTQVREVARQLGKKVRLEVTGASTELDKVLINQLTDPLLHILRNSIDHGVEAPEKRLAAGKPETGRIQLSASYQGSHAVIEVADDGAGIATERVLRKAIDAGLVPPEKAPSLTRAEIFDLIFEPGLSTAAQVSAVSGRGVGMDVVKTAIRQVQGSLSVESTPGVGTTIRMKLPLTLAVVGILLVRERSHQFAFPIQNVEEILTVRLGEVRRASNTIYNHRGTTLPVTTLSAILDFPPSQFAAVSSEGVPMVILSEGETRIAILIDEVLGRQEVLIKNLGGLIKKAPFVMGCTILSDSRLVLILNTREIVTARSGPPLVVPNREGGAHSRRKAHTILVVDDSSIQRENLRAILGHAGYSVETAENGFEGLKRVRDRRVTALCVDVVMPLMDGFEFVERLRRLPGYRDSPTFIITSRTNSEERERATALGVQAYFEKPVDAELLVQALDRVCLPQTGEARVSATG